MVRKDKPRSAPLGPRRFDRGSDTPADWSTASPSLLHELICAVSAFGGAVRFGYTSDGGAYSIGILGDGEPYTEYVRPSEDLNSVLEAMVIAYSK